LCESLFLLLDSYLIGAFIDFEVLGVGVFFGTTQRACFVGFELVTLLFEIGNAKRLLVNVLFIGEGRLFLLSDSLLFGVCLCGYFVRLE
jgi:hypothetical protein